MTVMTKIPVAVGGAGADERVCTDRNFRAVKALDLAELMVTGDVIFFQLIHDQNHFSSLAL